MLWHFHSFEVIEKYICINLFNSHNHDTGKQSTNPMIDLMSMICEVLCLHHGYCTDLCPNSSYCGGGGVKVTVKY